MYLKKLEIQGFKSFAEKTSLEFNSGITSVVGPNGSGKSNISDAVRWVLGEQSIKTLRGAKMEDVIFAGTEHRKPLGFAEVSLCIDNSDNTLPVAYSEVTITRRIFRSGESEYLINKGACRLKDINELFLDTGLGKDGYSIIGQGRVDEILSSRSEDRRHIFEEASGIMKYKVRKMEAERKLELTKQNLVRITDIINELESQIEPLRIQSEIAKKYLNLRDSLKELEINVYIENISKFKEKVKEFDEQYTTIKENIELENTKLENVTRDNKQKTDLVKSLDDKLNNARQEFYNLEGTLERCNSEIKVNDEKINNLTQNITRIDSEINEINLKMNQLLKEENTKQDKIKYLNARYEDYSSKLKKYEEQMEILLVSLDESERYIENLKTGIMDKMDLISDKKMQINNVKTHIEGLKKRQISIDHEIYDLTHEVDKENMKKEDLSENIYKIKEAIKISKSKLEVFIKTKNEKENDLDSKRKLLNTIKSDIQVKNSRHKMLEDMEKNLEGYNRSVKMVLQACNQSPEFGKGIRGALAQLITVEKRFETAIEMTLGSALQNIVTSTEEDAKRAIEYLKKNNIGRATFLPISSVNGKYFDVNLINDLKKHEGFCGIASDLISFSPEYKGIVLSFLGKVVVTENLDSGIKLARKFGYSFRIVTLEGDVISTSGSMSGGSNDSRGTGILSRNRDIIDIKDEIDKLFIEEVVVERNIGLLVTKLSSLL